ncbi:hypothetical protein B0T13DRAFT_15064 [Neurospora crassa]|nr:hypothetical protein B0T13DRAFT_15064 [Neurospora crassa]
MEGTYAQPPRVIRHRTLTLLRRLDDIAMPPHKNFNHMIVRESQKVVADGIFPPPQPPKTSEPTTHGFGPSRHRWVRVRSRSDGRVRGFTSLLRAFLFHGVWEHGSTGAAGGSSSDSPM